MFPNKWAYFFLKITPTDPLPKTICKTCMQRVEEHHKLLKTFCKNNAKFEAVLASLNATRSRYSRYNRTSNNNNSGQAASVNIATIEELRPEASVAATSSTSTSSVASTSNLNYDNNEE